MPSFSISNVKFYGTSLFHYAAASTYVTRSDKKGPITHLPKLRYDGLKFL